MDFQNARHKIHNFAISASTQPRNLIKYANSMFSGSENHRWHHYTSNPNTFFTCRTFYFFRCQ